MMGRKLKLIAAGSVAVFAVQAPAFAGTKDDVRDLQARMNVVEQAATAQSRSTVKIAELEAQIQALTGQIEELSFQLDQANLRLDSMSAVLAGETPTSDGGTPYLDAGGGPVDLTPRDPIADALAQADAPSQTQSPVQGQGQSLGGANTGAVELPLDANAAFDYSMGFLLKFAETPKNQGSNGDHAGSDASPGVRNFLRFRPVRSTDQRDADPPVPSRRVGVWR